jgi:CelD/BcsL family acetyltransferase involved in cellulose biosynthesis
MTQPDCTIEVITSHREFAELEPAWNNLVDEAGLTHPFLTHEWMWTWWECFGRDAELNILLVRAGGELIAIAPLMRTRQRVFGRRLRCLRFLANDHTPRCDFIVGSRPHDAYAAISKFLMNDAADMVALRDLSADSRTLEELSIGFERGGALWGQRHSHESPFLPLVEKWEENLPAKRRWFLRNRLKRLGAMGRVELETVSAGSEVTDALDEGFRLEAAAWKGEAGTAIACDAAVRRFYTLLAERAASRGWLRLQFLKVGDQRIAFAFALAYKKRMYLLKPAFDPAYAPYSPGNLLTHLVLRDAFASGFTAYDFLGRDDHWKRQWSTKTLPHYWLFVYANRPWARAAHYAKFELIPILQKLPLYARLRDSVLQLRADS